MTTKNRLWRLLAVIFAFTLIAAACGDDDTDNAGDGTSDDGGSDDSDDSGDDGGDDMADDDMADDDMADDDMADDDMGDDGGEHSVISDECAIPNPAETVEIDLMGWSFPIVDQYAAELEECGEGNYDFNVQFLDSQEARSQVTLDLESGSPSFEIVQGSNSFIIELANKGLLMPLNDLIDQYGDASGIALAKQQAYPATAATNQWHPWFDQVRLTVICYHSMTYQG